MTEMWIGELLDRAGAALLKLEEEGLLVSEFRVSPRIRACFVALRRDELADGLPLMVLGAEVVEDAALDADEFALIP